MDGDDDSDQNNSEVCNVDYISQLLSRSHNAYNCYGQSDAETGIGDESVDAPDSGESQSSVNLSDAR
ncbi:Far1 [Hordeum vulgare]|nr:Far1 [Hordeum vulgare]